MRYYTLIFIFTINLFALDIFVNSGIENLEKYSIVHLIDTKEFSCSSNKNRLGDIKEVTCFFDKMPAEKDFLSSKSQFFQIKRELFGDKFVIRIIPNSRAKLYQHNFDMKNATEISSKMQEFSKHWFVVAYQQNLPFIAKDKSKGVNFPIDISSVRNPYIGALDIAKKPIFFNKNIDIGYYLEIKNYYKEEDYERLIESVDEALALSPDTMFRSDFLLYKIRALAELPDMEDVLLDLAKSWVKGYPSDEAVPEVLLMIAQAYIALGTQSEANYYFDRVLTEHSEDKYAKLAMIYLGDEKESEGDDKSAIRLYKEALYSTKDLKIASIAAARLAYKYLEKGDKAKAQEFYEKVLKANPRYLVKDEFKAYTLAKDLADKKLFSIAKQIGDMTVKKIEENKLHDIYELVLRDTAYWHDMDKDVQIAYDLYHRYLKEFPFGDFVNFVNIRLDHLFFDMNEDNRTKLLNTYNELIGKYGKSDVGDKALYEKTKLLLDMENYQGVLDLEDRVLALDKDIAPEANQTVQSAAMALATINLDKKKCRPALKLKAKYDLMFSENKDKELAYCALKTANYKVAIELSKKNIKTKDLELRLSWLKLYMKALLKERDFYGVIDLSKDILSLADILNDKKAEKVLYDVFYANLELKKEKSAIEVADDIESRFVDDFENIDIYKKLVKIGSKKSDDFMVLKYAQKVMSLQNMYKSYIESPQIELIYMQSLINLNRSKEAIDFSQDIPNIEKLSPKSRTRMNYLLGLSYQKLDNEEQARAKFNECSKTKENTSWKKLCQDAIKLLNY